MKYRVTYYRTLIFEGEIEADTLDRARQEAESRVARMRSVDFDQVLEEEVEIDSDNMSAPLSFVTFCQP